jgi:hypothetical protein
MATQELKNVDMQAGNRVLTIHITPVTELAVREANVVGNKAPAAELITRVNTQVAKAMGTEGLDITGLAVTTNSSGFNAQDGLSNAEKYGILLAKLSGLDKANGGSIDASLKQIKSTLSSEAESLDLLDQGRQQALLALQKDPQGAVFLENTELNRQLLGEVVITSQALNPSGQLLITGKALPGSTVQVTMASGTQNVLVNPQGQFSLLSTDVQNQLNVPLKVVTQDGLGQSVSSTVGLKPQVTESNSLTVDSASTLSPDQMAGVSNQAVAGLTSEQLQAVKPDTLAALSVDQLAALTPAQWAALTVAQLGAMGLTGITAANLAAVSAALGKADDETQLNTQPNVQSVVTAAINALNASTSLAAALAGQAGDAAVAATDAAQLATQAQAELALAVAALGQPPTPAQLASVESKQAAAIAAAGNAQRRCTYRCRGRLGQQLGRWHHRQLCRLTEGHCHHRGE